MNKIVALGVLSGLGGLGYLGYQSIKKLEAADIVLQMQPEEIKLSPKAFQKASKLVSRITPYAGFCEITGCKHEIHANKPHLFDRAMSDHLSKDHP